MSSFVEIQGIWNNEMEDVNNLNIEPRGGSTIIDINNNLIIFGGVNREQKHYNDMFTRKSNNHNWEDITTLCYGDIPTCRRYVLYCN